MAQADGDDLKKQLTEACKAGDFDELARLSIEAFDQDSLKDHDLLGWISKVVSDNNLIEAFWVAHGLEGQSPSPRPGST